MQEQNSVVVKRRVQLHNLFNETINTETEEESKDSVFAPIYKKADKLVEAIKENTKKIEKIKIEQSGNLRQEQLQIVNTISFEGRRGTGKTSAMMSFCNKLKKKTSGGKQSFIVLEYIDASALEEGESILEIVLANMYHELSEVMSERGGVTELDYESRNIIRMFEGICESISFINERSDRNGRSGDLSPLSGLEKLSNSQQLKKDVYQLVCKFTEVITKNSDAMLVIPVDDIDMCFQSEEPSVYEVMETLHRYLMIPKVVILLTYDYPELLSGCEKHFSQMHYKKNVNKQQQEHIREAANRYLEKLLPTYARIHLPSQQKRDYSEQNNIQVCLDQEETKEYLKEFKDYLPKNSDGTVNLNPKQFALLFKASNCGLFYDSQGKKRHYAEPSDFRDMVHIVTMCNQYKLNDGEAIDVDNAKDEDEIVYKELLDDLYFRFARIHIKSKDEYDRYNEYLKVNIERRTKDILVDIWNLLEEDKDYKGGLSKIQYNGPEENNSSYSYGELLYGLFLASTYKKFSKGLIWCILDSYTIMLSKLCRAIDCKEKECFDKEDEEQATEDLIDSDAYKAVSKIIGSSISSSWSNCFVPTLENRYSARGENAQSDNSGSAPDKPSKTSVGSIKYIDTNQTIKWEFKKNHEDKDAKGIFQTIEILCMFFTDVKNKNGDGFAITYYDGSSENIPGADNIGIKFEFVSGCFNILNFVNNLFLGELFFKSLHEELQTPFKECFSEQIDSDTTLKNRDKWLDEYSLKQEFMKWKKEYGRCALPLYSFDMMYNIMKRQKLNTDSYINDKAVGDEEFLKSLLRVYDELNEKLKEQDEFYYRTTHTGFSRFSVAFEECPFIKYMSKIKEELDSNGLITDKKHEYLTKFFRDCVLAIRFKQ